MSSIDQYFNDSNNISMSFDKESIIQQLKSNSILMKYLPDLDTFAEYNYKGRIDKKQSLHNKLSSIGSIKNQLYSYSFVEIRGNGACLYNSVLVGIMLQNKGVTINNLLNELVPHDEIPISNPYNKQIIDFIVGNYFLIDSALEPFGKKYLETQFGLEFSPDDTMDIALYGFTKSLLEPVQNFQQLGGLVSSLFNVVIVLFQCQINAEINDNVELNCITPNKTNNLDIIKNNLQTNLWQVVYVINTSTHYNLVLPHSDINNLLLNESKVFFNQICDKLRFV
jgi:hypothetical protein